MTTTPTETDTANLERLKRLAELLDLDGELVQRVDDPHHPFGTVELIDEITASVLHELKMMWYAEMNKATRTTVERLIDRDVYAGKLIRLPSGGYLKTDDWELCPGCGHKVCRCPSLEEVPFGQWRSDKVTER